MIKFKNIFKNANEKYSGIISYLKSINIYAEFPSYKTIILGEFIAKQNIIYQNKFYYIVQNKREVVVKYDNVPSDIQWLVSEQPEIINNEDIFRRKVRQLIEKGRDIRKLDIWNEYIVYRLQESKSFFILTDNDLVILSTYTAKKMNGQPFFIQLKASYAEKKLWALFSSENNDIEGRIEIDDDTSIAEQIYNEVKKSYLYHFITETTLKDHLQVNSLDEYDEETHGIIVKMLVI